MIDATKQIVSTLKTATGLKVYPEVVEHPYTLPCITYQQYDNADTLLGNKISYSSIAYYIKLWGNDLSTLMPTIQTIDTALKGIGYTRESYNELAVDTDICLITQYRALGKEERI